MGTSGDLSEEQVRILMDAYNQGGTLGGAHHAIPSIGADTVEPLIYGLARLKRALQLACSHEYLDEALKGNIPKCYMEVGFQIVRQVVSDLRWVVLGAGTGALLCGAAGSAVPVVGNIGGASAGASLGAAVATYVLTGVSVVTAAKFIGEISGYASVDLEEGVRSAVRGDVEAGARMLASGMAKVLAFLLPTLILMLLGKVGKVASNRFLRNPNVAQYLARLPAPITNVASASGLLGMTTEEIRAIAAMSRGKLLVMRGCNPARLKYILARYHAKPVYIKWKTAKSGPYVGQVVLTEEEALKVLAHYKGNPPGGQIQTLSPSSELIGKGNKPLMHDPSPTTGGPWLENHKLEKFRDADGSTKYRILHPDGKPFVGDIDRVLYAELTGRGTVRPGVVGNKNHWELNDDAREIAYMNEQVRNRMGQSVSYNIFQHGNAWNLKFKDANGKWYQGWPGRTKGTYVFDNEPLLVCCNGHAYVMGWNEFAELCRCHNNVGLHFPWDNFVVK